MSKDALSKPGPGHYDNAKNFGDDANTFSIRGRPQDKVRNEVPGPGNYNPPEQDPTKERVVAYKLGTSSRSNLVGREATLSPGPGQYDSPRKDNGPQFTIRERSRSPNPSANPGPGAYDANDSPTRF